jgi:hypothetical protein
MKATERRRITIDKVVLDFELVMRWNFERR